MIYYNFEIKKVMPEERRVQFMLADSAAVGGVITLFDSKEADTYLIYPHGNTIHIHIGQPSRDLSSESFNLEAETEHYPNFSILRRENEGGSVAIGYGCGREPIYVDEIPVDIYVTRDSYDWSNITIVFNDGRIQNERMMYFYTNVLSILNINPYKTYQAVQYNIFKELVITIEEGIS